MTIQCASAPRGASLVPTPDITLYVTTTGNDANNGSTPALAKRSLYGAWVLLSAGAYNNARVYIEAGDYYNDQGWKAITLGVSSASPPEVDSLEIIGYGGRVRLLAQDAALTYSSAGSGAYSTTLATAFAATIIKLAFRTTTSAFATFT